MGGISSGVGVFSGIDSRSLIDQLIAVESRPKAAVQRRIVQLQSQQAAFLDFNSKLDSLRRVAKSFRDNKVFSAFSAASSDDKVLTATASATASPGSYQLIVDRLVTTQQMLSRGFADRDASGLGATSVTVESWQGRLDRDVALADLNGGAGVARGKVTITDSASRTTTVDLSRVATISEVVELINSNGTAQVTASVQDDKLVVRDNAGGSLTIADAPGYSTATSLGIAGTGAGGQITGSSLYGMSAGTLLSTLNDGNGVFIRNTSTPADWTFRLGVTVGGNAVNVDVNIGDVYETQDGNNVKTKSAATTVGEVLDRINQALTAAGATTVSASIAADGKRLEIVDTAGNAVSVTESGSFTTAADLGLSGTASNGNMQGKRVMSGMGTTLARSLAGGAGLAGDGILSIRTRDGAAFDVQLSADWSLSQIASFIESQTANGATNRLRVELNDQGTGLKVTDLTGGGQNLIISGTNGNTLTSDSLGLTTAPSGVASSVVMGTNVQRQYVSRATPLSQLNNGRGVGTGVIRITSSDGTTREVDIASDTRNVGDLLDEINISGARTQARINATGDGIEFYESVPPGQEGSAKIKIEDLTGSVAKGLNVLGEAAGTGVNNKINGSYERTITLAATDSLSAIAGKINAAGAGLSAAVVRDGVGATPFRLSLSATGSGTAGRFVFTSAGVDLGLSTIQRGTDARAFYGSSDVTQALLIGSSTNTIDDAIPGVKIDLKSASTTPVTLTVSRDQAKLEASVNEFITAFNDLVGSIDSASKYNVEAKRGGPLVGDGIAIELRAAAYRVVQAEPVGVGGRFTRLSQVGVEVGSGGRLSLDADAFRRAMTEDPAAVEALFTARTSSITTQQTVAPGITVRDPNAGEQFSQLGVMGQVEEMVKSYLDSVTGRLTIRRNSLDTQVRAQNQRIAEMDTRLEARRAVLEQQFLRMERAIGQLQSQQSSLSSLSGLRR